ncbi:GtrA family protein [Devosia sp. XJ19-1]|uniref:GtrA family protein n=1 Tax=Devosia ureilytica TaxID=2952754 RepID=A0A9Q4FSP9_9HYPH|nr:GtrA family protein [Devosia ureilytica]MCP8883456.1 GtrA family protein [Devosia ureilytica]MCP8887064.1 GtrA family protein [Devosia ureilytica]
MASFSKYLLTAGAATVVDVATVQLCLQFLAANISLSLGLAIAIGAACGLSVNFLLSRRFVFRSDGRRVHQQFLTFLGVSISTAVLRIVVAYSLAALLGLPVFAFLLTLPISLPIERLAHLGAVGLVTIYSFLAHRHISFAGGFRNRLRARTTMVS